MKIQESAENYLETILMLRRKKGQVRSIDIATELSFSKPSISFAMKQFRENGLISVDENGYISLTEKGTDIANRVFERHELLTEFLVGIGVDRDTAKEDACRIEHILSEASFEKIKEAVLKTRN